MSRVIKFRAIFKEPPGNIEIVYFPLLEAECYYLSDADCIDQYTGLKDKNGVEIYEGDLLRIPAKSQHEETTFNCFEVFYHDNHCIGGQNIGFCMNRMHTQGSSAGGPGYKFTPQSIENNGFVVCGNIHESPELLEVSQ